MPHDIKPGDTVYGVIANIYEDGSRDHIPFEASVVNRLAPDHTFFACRNPRYGGTMGRYWLEWVCRSPLGHLGMPCVFCGQSADYFRVFDLCIGEMFEEENEEVEYV